MAGLPPYLPGDLIEVDIDEDEAIWISDGRPLRPARCSLTRQEALAVQRASDGAARHAGRARGAGLASALAKLGRAGSETLGDAAVDRRPSRAKAPPHLDAVRDAAAEHRADPDRLRRASTGERTERTVEPEAVFADTGRWYVAAVGRRRRRRATAAGRPDRRRSSRGRAFTPRGLEGAGRPLYTPGPDDVEVRVAAVRGGPLGGRVLRDDRSGRGGRTGAVEATLPARRPGPGRAAPAASGARRPRCSSRRAPGRVETWRGYAGRYRALRHECGLAAPRKPGSSPPGG